MGDLEIDERYLDSRCGRYPLYPSFSFILPFPVGTVLPQSNAVETNMLFDAVDSCVSPRTFRLWVDGRLDTNSIYFLLAPSSYSHDTRLVSVFEAPGIIGHDNSGGFVWFLSHPTLLENIVTGVAVKATTRMYAVPRTSLNPR